MIPVTPTSPAISTTVIAEARPPIPCGWISIRTMPPRGATPVPGLTNGIEYTFEVRAKAGDDEGASSSVTATPVPAKPANFRAASGNRRGDADVE